MDRYLLCFVFMLYLPLHYLFFRVTVASALRAGGMSRTALKRAMEGKRNFWFYEELHRVRGLGWMYRLNKWFLFCYPAAAVCHPALGWIDGIGNVTGALTGVAALLEAGMWAATGALPRGKDAGKQEMVFGVGLPLLMGLAVIFSLG